MGDTRSAESRRLLPALLAAPLVALGCGAPSERAPDLPGALYEPPRPAPALRLTGAGGPYDLASDRGRVVLVFFGFTSCPDICPATLENWAEVRRLLGADAARVRFLFVSVDPARDTPEIAARFASGFDASFVGVSGSEAEIRETALAWGVAARRADEAGGAGAAGGAPGASDAAGGYDVIHASQVFVVDGAGLLRWGYGRSVGPEGIAAGIRSFLGERSPPS